MLMSRTIRLGSDDAGTAFRYCMASSPSLAQIRLALFPASSMEDRRIRQSSLSSSMYSMVALVVLVVVIKLVVGGVTNITIYRNNSHQKDEVRLHEVETHFLPDKYQNLSEPF